MDIYNSNGIKLEYSEVLANLPITESCEHVEELMKADHIVLSWRDSEKYTLPVGAYITYKGVNYALLEPYEPEQKSGDEFEYTPNFQHPKMYLGKVPFRFPTTDTEGNSITLLEWPYSGDIDTLLTFFCRTMESELGLTANTFNYSILGEIDMVVSTTFNAVDILSALSNIANQLKCEWHIDWDYKILYFGHIELSRDEVDETVLEVGVNVGTPSVRSSKEGFYNTYEPQGSTRNISKRAASGEYVQGDVRLTLNEEDYPDKVIYTNESGTVIASLPQGVKKYVKPLIFDNIYPKLDLYVYDVRCRERYLLDDNGEKIVDHYDGSTPVYKRYAVWYMRLAYPTKVGGHVTHWNDYTINPETDIISGKNLGGAFQPNNYNGAESFPLAGRGNADDGGYGFELNYHTTAETIPANPNDGDTGVIIKAGDYEIVFQQQNDYILPTTASQGIIPKGVKVNGQEVTDLNGLTNLDDGQKGNIVDLYNIVIGSAYTESAQDELANETLKYITNQFKDNNSYTLKSDVVAFKKRIDQDELLHTDSSLYIGEKVIYKNGDYELETRVMKLVTKLDYAFVQEITVGNEVLKGTTTTLKEQVQTILSGGVGNGSGGGGVDAGAVRKIVQAYANPRFLSKLNDDTAQGFITMLKGLQIGANFIPDILGEGGVLRMRDDGKVELVTDILYARMRAYFDSVVIREYKHESGNRIVSPAQGFNASRVAYIKVVNNEETIVENASDADYFRCYWRVDDGEKKTENQFVIGDLAFCEHADVVNGSLITKRYWRVVVGRNAGNTTTEDGEAWIDLSNAHDANGNPMMTTISWEGQGGVTQTLSVKSFESSTNGIPEAHDDICMLGCTTDTTRQGAIIEYVSGTDAPTYQIYQGLGSDATNPYVLTNKNQISFGYNSSTGKAYMNVYGDAYIGDRNRNTFLEYKQNGVGGNPELNIKAKVQILPNGSTINGQSIPDYIKDNQNNYDDTEVKADIVILNTTTQDLQKQIDGAIETWFMTGVPTLQNAPANEWTTDDEKDKHIGDLYYDKATTYAYRFLYDDETDTYGWQHITDDALAEALRIASEAQETADGKRTTYSVWGAWMKNNVNTLEVGDLFIPAANTTQGGVTYKANKVYKCTTDGSATFQSADYIDDAQAQAKVDAFVSNTYNPDKINLQSQIDGKAETFRQATDPSSSWSNADKPKHVGDLWMDISADGGKKTKIYQNIGTDANPIYDWVEQEVPDEVFDEIDGKSTIFGNAIATPPTDYKKDDMWLLPAAATINGTAYKKGDVLSASQDSTTYSAAHWSKKIRYTDDTAFNGYIDAFLNGSSQSGDSFTVAAIQKAITSALGSALGSATIIDGGLMLTSLIGMRQLNDGGDPSQISDYTTWAGISGQYVARDAADPQDPTAPWAKGHGIAAWYGGDMVDKEMLTPEQIGTVDPQTGVEIGWPTLRWAKSIDRFDGSGYRANGNITWNEQGQLVIKNITTLSDSNNKNILNELATFNSAFTFGTSGQGSTTALYITPNVPFESLYIGTSNANKKEVATREWVGNNYVSTAFFRQLFRAFKPNATAGQADVEVQPNTIDATISNIKAMVGFWTEQYVSALGNSSDGGGGGGGASVLYGLNDVTPNATGDGVMGAQDGYVLTYNGSTHHWYAAATAETYVLPQATANALGGIKIGYSGTTAKTYAVALDTNGKAYVNVPWTDNNTWIPWAGATENAAGTAGYMPAPTSAQRTQFLRGDGTWVSLNNYSLPLAASGARGGVQIGYTTDATNRNYAVQLSSEKMYVNVPWENTTYSAATQSAAGLMSTADKKKLDGVAENANNYSLPLAASGTRGGVQIGYTESGKNYAVQLSSEKMYVYVPWENTWRGIQNNLTSDSTTDSLSAAQGKALKGSITTLEGYFTNGVAKKAEQLNTSRTLWGQNFNGTANVSGNMTGVGNITMSANDGTYIKIGDIYIGYDSTNSAIEIYKLDENDAHVAANLYAHGAISALGQGVDGGGGGQGDVTWALLADNTDTRQIALSHLTTALAGYSTTSHTHTTTIAVGASTDTSQLTLAHGTKYKLTAGETSFVFTMPSGYSLPTASSSTLGGVKVGSTLAISSGVLNLATSGVTAGTYKRVTVDAYGRVTAGDDTDSNTWRNIYLGGTSKVGTGTDTKALNFVAGSNVTISYEAAGTGNGKSGSADYFNIKIAATDTTYSAVTQSAAGLMSAADKKKLDGVAESANNYSLPLAASGTRGGVKIGYTTNAANRNYAVQLSSEKMYVNVPWTDTTYSVFVGSGSTAAAGLVPKPSTTAGTTKFLREDATWVEPAYPTNYYASDTTRTKNTVLAAPNGSNGVATFRALVAADIPNLGAGKITSGTFDAARIPDLSSTYAAVGRVDDLESYFTNGVANKAEELNTSRSLWGQSFNGTADVSGNMTGVGDISFSASGKKIGNFLYFDTTNTRLGVNTSSPSYRLHVNGTFYASGNSSIGGTFGVTGATTLTGLLTANGGIAIASSKTLKIGDIYLAYDSTNNAIEVYKLDGTNHVAANLYARGGIAALGETSDGGGGGQGDVTWALLASDSDTRQIALSHLTTALSGYSTTSHTHTTTIASSTGTSQISLTHGGRFSITAGGTSYIFTMPSDNNSWRNIYVAGTEKLTTATNTKAINFVAGNNVSISFAAAGTGSGQSGNANYGTLTISATDTTYTLAGLMGSTAIGGTTQPIYWNGSAFANTSYTLGKSVPSNAVFTDTTYSAGTGLSLSGTTFSVKTPSSGAYFDGTAYVASDGVMEIGRYIDFHPTSASTLDYNIRLDAGNGTTARIFTFPDSSGTLLSSGNSSVSLNGSTLTVKINGTEQSLTNTNTTYSASTGLSLSGTAFSVSSTYQTYISHGESAYNSLGNYLPLVGGKMTGEVTMNWGSASSDQFINFKASDNIVYSIGIRRPANTYGLCYVENGSYYNVWHQGNLTNLSQLTNDSGYITSSGSCNYATSAGNADTCDGLHVHTGRNYDADKIVRTDSNGHIQCGYINSSGDEANNSSPARVWGTNGSDSYMRTYLTSALSVNTANRVGNGMNYIYCTSNEVNFGGTYNTDIIEFGATAKDSKPKPTVYKFGGSSATAAVFCNNIYTPNISSVAIGSGTYTTMRWGLYSDHYEFEFPNTDDTHGVHIPIYMGWRGGVYALTITSTGDIVGMAGVTALSDARHKQVIRDTNLSVEQIANMPSVIFKWTDEKHDNDLHVGTLAQNWQQVLPEVVNVGNDKEHTLSLSYGVAALVAAITTARKVVDHEKRITELERENKELREEISRLKIA